MISELKVKQGTLPKKYRKDKEMGNIKNKKLSNAEEVEVPI